MTVHILGPSCSPFSASFSFTVLIDFLVPELTVSDFALISFLGLFFSLLDADNSVFLIFASLSLVLSA